MVLGVVFLCLFFFFASKDLTFAKFIIIIMTIMNVQTYLIRKYIKDADLKPKNDPGIVIWWMCCLRQGQSSSFESQAALKTRKNSMKYKAAVENERTTENEFLLKVEV